MNLQQDTQPSLEEWLYICTGPSGGWDNWCRKCSRHCHWYEMESGPQQWCHEPLPYSWDSPQLWQRIIIKKKCYREEHLEYSIENATQYQEYINSHRWQTLWWWCNFAPFSDGMAPIHMAQCQQRMGDHQQSLGSKHIYERTKKNKIVMHLWCLAYTCASIYISH